MKHLLLLVHRIPFPPNKGDKVRSYHLLKYLAKEYRVHLGTFIDAEEDWQHINEVKKLCRDTHFARLEPKAARIKSLRGMLTGQALTLPYYANKGLQQWVESKLTFAPIKHIVIFSSAMAQYLPRQSAAIRVADMVDIDSDKWSQYAKSKSWPVSWLYRREAKRLLVFERQVAQDFDATVFVNERESDLFKTLAPESAERVTFANNGVDTDYFSPAHSLENPYQPDEDVLAFTGAMDYWPNVDAAEWFAREIFSKIHGDFPRTRFYVVGARPDPKIQKLAELPGVIVTGSVADIRPFLAHARLAVAPLRIARGTQNKVLEAMAMAKTVIASQEAAQGVAAEPERELIVARTAQEFVDQITSQLTKSHSDLIGNRARARVLQDYSWDANLSKIGRLLQHSDEGWKIDEPLQDARIIHFPSRKSA